MEDEDAVDVEVDILSGMYSPEECEIIREEAMTTCKLHLVPHTASGEFSTFSKLTLSLNLKHATYPNEPPTISFHKVRGLNDSEQKELMELMRIECEELAGDYVCSSLAAIATDYITEHNTPPKCSICLEPINNQEENFITTSNCFHFFHATCLTSWWYRCALSAATGMRAVSTADVLFERKHLES